MATNKHWPHDLAGKGGGTDEKADEKVDENGSFSRGTDPVSRRFDSERANSGQSA